MSHASVLDLFERRLTADPHRPAVGGADGTRTFGEVDRAAWALVRAASAPRPPRGARIAFLGVRDADFPAVALAVFRLGGVYVPLDPDWPAERLARIVARSEIRTAFVSSGTEQRVAERLGIDRTVVVGDAVGGGQRAGDVHRAGAPPGRERPRPGGGEAAYLMCTSGTTGPAKGVLVAHRSLALHCERLSRRLGLDGDSRVLQFTSATIDISLEEIHAAWAAGGTVVTLPDAVRADLGLFARYLECHRVTCVDVPTSYWLTWLDAAERGELPVPGGALRQIGVGSEELPPDAVERWLRLGSRVGLYNLYGATETTITPVVEGPIGPRPGPRPGPSAPGDEASGADGDVVPGSIGRPMDGVVSHVLDEDLTPVRPGERGQLHLGGDVVALGYEGDPALTARAFVPDPFSPRPGARMYATGDMVSELPDGRLRFHHRADGLVNVRGFTVDPRRIEEVITRVPGAGAARVFLDRGGAAPRLIAAVEPEGSRTDQVIDGWREVYDALYGSDMAARPDTLNAASWFSAADGARLSDATMERWRDDIAAKLLALRPKRVLELGCGTGMILHALHSHVDRYVGVDFSRAAIDFLRGVRGTFAPRLDLSLIASDLLAALRDLDESFDLVLLNSVVQYFPDDAYLGTVLDAAARRVSPGGHIVVGDVRNLDHLAAYHRWLADARADRSDRADRPDGAERSRTEPEPAGEARRTERAESELVLSPAYFTRTTEIGGRAVEADVTVKYTDDASEMTAFRFDAVLRLDSTGASPGDPAGPSAGTVREARETSLRAADLAPAVRAGAPLLVRDVPLHREDPAHDGPDGTREPGGRHGAPPGRVAVGALRAALRERGLRAEAAPAADAADRCDLVVSLPEDARAALRLLRARRAADSTGPVARSPQDRGQQELRSAVAAEVRRALPRHAWPDEYRVTERPAGTAHAPTAHTATATTTSTATAQTAAARTDTARTGAPLLDRVTEIWQLVLGGQSPGPDDDFFDLGGNSLNLTRVLMRLRSALDVELSVREFFANPTIRGLTRIVAQRKGSPAASAGAGAPLTRGTGLSGPATFAQERLWLLDQLFPDSGAYHSPFAFTVDGPLDPAALRAAAESVARAHPTLRTAVRMVDGQVVQEITGSAPEVTELAHAAADLDDPTPHDPPPDGAEALSAAEHDFVHRPFDLGSGAVFRLGWRRVAPARHRLVFVVHHIAIDELSLRPFFEDFSRAYAAARGDGPAPRGPAVRCLDYARWERTAEQERRRERDAGFWKEFLDGAPTLLSFPTDRPRPAVQSGRGRRCAIDLPAGLQAEIRRFLSREGITAYQFWLALFGLFLGHETGEKDVVVGAPSANRELDGLEPLVGFFVNTLPVRLRRDSDPTVGEFAHDTADRLVAAQAAGHVPFQRILDAAGVRRGLGHNPLYQTMVVLEPEAALGLTLAGREAVPVDVGETTSTVDLSLIVRPEGPDFRPRFCYNPDLFGEHDVTALRARFLALLSASLADPARRTGDRVRPAPARASVLSGATTDTTELVPAHLAVRRAAVRHPHRTAVISSAGALDYRSLLAWADGIATELSARGPLPAFVPLLLDSGAGTVASMLAVNALGKAFVPLDPAWPLARREAVLAGLGAAFCLTDEEHAPKVTGGAAPLVLPRPPSSPAAVRDDGGWRGGLDTAMYAVHTSGSTGMPKAAVNQHRGVANRLDWMTRTFGPDAARVVLQTTPPQYDSSVWEHLWPLTLGGTTVIGPPTLQTDPAALCRTVAEHGVTTLDLVPGLFRNVLRYAAREPAARAALGGVRCAVVGGEEFTEATARLVRASGLGARVVNLYGPTEASIGSVFHELEPGGGTGRVPIGRPVQNTTALVLDESFAPVPLGVPGELFLGGACVGAGYLGNPAGTRRRFLDTREFGLLYRTGDRARVREDGALDFLGRLDQQWNLNGVRTEPAEIVRNLEAVAGVAEAVVVRTGRRSGDAPRAHLEERFRAALTSPDTERRTSAHAVLRLLEQET